MSIIKVEDLKKNFKVNVKKEGVIGAIVNVFNPKYEIKEAVKGISFSIEEGEMVGYIGANGAGKSTTIKMLTGILTPSSGQILIHGKNPYKNRISNNMKIGAIFGQRTQMWWDLPVIESYKLIQKLYEIPEETYRRNLAFFTEFLELEDLLKVSVRQLSLGQKMRCEIAATFIHDPKIVFLDEPSIGLDFMVKEKIRDFIKTLNKEKKVTVILTTHDLQDIEEICSRIIIIDNGLMVYDGSLDAIMSEFSQFSSINFKIKSFDTKFDSVLSDSKDLFSLISKDSHNLNVRFDRNKTTVTRIMDRLSNVCEIVDLSISEASIDTVVKALYETKIND